MSGGTVPRGSVVAATVAAALAVLGAGAVLATVALAADGEPGIPAAAVLAAALVFAGPHTLAAALVVVAAARTAAAGEDGPARLLALATAGLRGRRDEWGVAMRAELASITGPRRERRRFAVGCAWTAARRGAGRSPWIVATASAAAFAALTVATSRAALAGDRAGSLWGVIAGPPQLTLLLVGFTGAWVGRSMRTGLEWGAAALVGVLIGVLAAAVPEGARWAQEAGVFMLDGDAPGTSLTAAAGARDAVAATLIWGLPLWLPWPVFGAAAGAWLRRRGAPVAQPSG